MSRIGKYTLHFSKKPSIIGYASVVSKKESEGPLNDLFDIVELDTTFGESSWEKAETRMQQLAFNKAISKANIKMGDIDVLFAGDLLNQCIGSSFASRNNEIPFLGVYGACSNMAETLLLSSMSVNSSYANTAIALTSSHFCTAERQYRFPLEYGGIRSQTTQWTVTGSGCCVVSKNKENMPYIEYATIGKIIDYGIKDAANMGAAMAPAACDTLMSFLSDTNTKTSDFDAIITGDLGKIGSSLLQKLLIKNGIDITSNHIDCGLMIFDDTQDVHSGASGCGCSAAVLCSYILKCLNDKSFKNILFIATGALLSTTSIKQGESIPSIAHLLNIKSD